ncbi:TPA: restriction endonuclease [Pseudomonas putida]|nr:restriction endonuclease [Pseudomonas putida]
MPMKSSEIEMHGYSDRELAKRIVDVQKVLKSWAVSKKLWYDCGFTTHAEHVDGEPGEYAVVFVLHSSGSLARLLDEDLDPKLVSEFAQIAGSYGFYYENIDGGTYYFFADDDELQEAYNRYFHWKWVCSLIVDDFGDIYAELYQYFQAHPDRLFNLHHRDFEILLHRVFQSLGYRSTLGPGTGDGGVDVKLLQLGPLGDTLTYVQAKCYAPHRPIGLGAVQALRGAVANDEADHGIVVTTSRYLPSAKAFANGSKGVIELKTSEDVAVWCQQAQDGIIKDKSLLVSDSNLLAALKEFEAGRHSLVVHAGTGYQTFGNSFALVLKETRHAALLILLPKQIVDQDAHGLQGREIPILDDRILLAKCADTVFRAKRMADSGGVSYWDGKNLYSAWDRKACFFSHID